MGETRSPSAVEEGSSKVSQGDIEFWRRWSEQGDGIGDACLADQVLNGQQKYAARDKQRSHPAAAVHILVQEDSGGKRVGYEGEGSCGRTYQAHIIPRQCKQQAVKGESHRDQT